MEALPMANWAEFPTTLDGTHKQWFNLDAAQVIKPAPSPHPGATVIIMPGDAKGLTVFEKIDVVAAHARGEANAHAQRPTRKDAPN